MMAEQKTVGVEEGIVGWDLFWQCRFAEFMFAWATMTLVWLGFGNYMLIPTDVTFSGLIGAIFFPIVVGVFFYTVLLYLPLGALMFGVLKLFGMSSIESFRAFNAFWYALYGVPFMMSTTRGDVSDPLWLVWGMIVLFNYGYPLRVAAIRQALFRRHKERAAGMESTSFDVVV